jgi:hypothetical protein
VFNVDLTPLALAFYGAIFGMTTLLLALRFMAGRIHRKLTYFLIVLALLSAGVVVPDTDVQGGYIILGFFAIMGLIYIVPALSLIATIHIIFLALAGSRRTGAKWKYSLSDLMAMTMSLAFFPAMAQTLRSDMEASLLFGLGVMPSLLWMGLMRVNKYRVATGFRRSTFLFLHPYQWMSSAILGAALCMWIGYERSRDLPDGVLALLFLAAVVTFGGLAMTYGIWLTPLPKESQQPAEVESTETTSTP